MENKEKITHVVNGRVSAKLSAKQLEQYQREYLEYLGKLDDMVQEKSPGADRVLCNLVLDKIASPFAYWLKDKLVAEAYNERLRKKE